MYIVDYERGEVANIDNATSIYVDESGIFFLGNMIHRTGQKKYLKKCLK